MKSESISKNKVIVSATKVDTQRQPFHGERTPNMGRVGFGSDLISTRPFYIIATIKNSPNRTRGCEARFVPVLKTMSALGSLSRNLWPSSPSLQPLHSHRALLSLLLSVQRLCCILTLSPSAAVTLFPSAVYVQSSCCCCSRFIGLCQLSHAATVASFVSCLSLLVSQGSY